jgi:hypothetical protein
MEKVAVVAAPVQLSVSVSLHKRRYAMILNEKEVA